MTNLFGDKADEYAKKQNSQHFSWLHNLMLDEFKDEPIAVC